MQAFRMLFLVLVAATAIGLSLAGTAHADTKDDAAAAYDRGAAAYDRGDFSIAATELARADELAQSAVTLELALNAAIRADNPVLGMTLVERAEKRKGTSTGSAKVDYAAENARKKLGAKVGRLSVVCPSSQSCVVALDGGAPLDAGAHYLAIGPHRLTVTRGGSSEVFDVTIEPGKTVEMMIPAERSSSTTTPPLPIDKTRKTEPEATSTSGISPTWFWIGAGVSLVAGGITIASGVDTVSKHNAFAADRSNADASTAGKSSEQRTVILMASTGALVAVTAVLGLFFVQWSAAPPKRETARLAFDVAVDPITKSGHAALGAAF